MRLAWVFRGDGLLAGTPSLDASGNCVFGSRAGTLTSVDSAGAMRWRVQTEGPVEAAPCVHPNGTIVFGSYDGRLRAVDDEGRVIWSVDFGAPVMTTPCVMENGDLVVGHDGGALERVSVEGRSIEHLPVTDLLSASPVCTNGVVYTCDESLYGTDGTDVALGDEPIVAGPAIGEDGTIYVGSWDGHLYAITPGPEGRVKWRVEIGGQIVAGASIGPDGRVLVGTRTGRVAAVSSAGEILWSILLPDGVYGTPAIAQGGVVFVGSNAARLYALNLQTGGVVGQVLGGRDFRSSLALGDNGRVLATCWDWNLYAIDGGAGGPAETPWAQFHGSAARRGRA